MEFREGARIEGQNEVHDMKKIYVRVNGVEIYRGFGFYTIDENMLLTVYEPETDKEDSPMKSERIIVLKPGDGIIVTYED